MNDLTGTLLPNCDLPSSAGGSVKLASMISHRTPLLKKSFP